MLFIIIKLFTLLKETKLCITHPLYCINNDCLLFVFGINITIFRFIIPHNLTKNHLILEISKSATKQLRQSNSENDGFSHR